LLQQSTNPNEIAYRIENDIVSVLAKPHDNVQTLAPSTQARSYHDDRYTSKEISFFSLPPARSRRDSIASEIASEKSSKSSNSSLSGKIRSFLSIDASESSSKSATPAPSSRSRTPFEQASALLFRENREDEAMPQEEPNQKITPRHQKFLDSVKRRLLGDPDGEN